DTPCVKRHTGGARQVTENFPWPNSLVARAGFARNGRRAGAARSACEGTLLEREGSTMNRLLLSWRLGLLASGLVFAVACSESTGPGDVFDPGIISQSATNVSDAMANNQAVQSLGVLGEDLSAAPSAPAPVGVQDPALRTL